MTDPSPLTPGPDQAGASPEGPAASGADDIALLGSADVSLLGLVDRLAAILDRSDLLELEIEAGGTGLLLRKPAALHWGPAPAEARSGGSGAPAHASGPAGFGDTAAGSEPAATRRSITAPLTGLFYTAPTPGSAPYVRVGGEVAIGQVIGLIEAMKLFNEIKADIAGRVVRIVPENGALVKAKQALIELEPL